MLGKAAICLEELHQATVPGTVRDRSLRLEELHQATVPGTVVGTVSDRSHWLESIPCTR